MHSPAYCTLADLLALPVPEAELLDLTDPTGSGVIDADLVAAAAETAATEIDPYLEGRVALPLTTVPDAVRRLAAILARYYLHAQGPTDHVQRQYDAAIATLNGIAAGRLRLGPETPAPEAGEGPQWDALPRAWGRGTSGGLA